MLSAPPLAGGGGGGAGGAVSGDVIPSWFSGELQHGLPPLSTTAQLVVPPLNIAGGGATNPSTTAGGGATNPSTTSATSVAAVLLQPPCTEHSGEWVDFARDSSLALDTALQQHLPGVAAAAAVAQLPTALSRLTPATLAAALSADQRHQRQQPQRLQQQQRVAAAATVAVPGPSVAVPGPSVAGKRKAPPAPLRPYKTRASTGQLPRGSLQEEEAWSSDSKGGDGSWGGEEDEDTPFASFVPKNDACAGGCGSMLGGSQATSEGDPLGSGDGDGGHARNRGGRKKAPEIDWRSVDDPEERRRLRRMAKNRRGRP